MKIKLMLIVDDQPKVSSSEITVDPKELKKAVDLLTDQLKEVVREEYAEIFGRG